MAGVTAMALGSANRGVINGASDQQRASHHERGDESEYPGLHPVVCLVSRVTLGKLLILSLPLFPHI